MNIFKAGVACRDIELVTGMDMTGYLARETRSEGVHDRLHIKTIIFGMQDKKAAIVICDLLGLSAGYIDEAASEAAETADISKNDILIACTHTHSGPASIFLRNCGEVDKDWLNRLKKDISGCIREAIENMRPALLSYTVGSCGISVNRDASDDIIKADLRDDRVGLLSVNSADDNKLIALLVNYACHPTVMGGDNLLYSADYPYYLEKSLKERISDDAAVIFTNGCCGDIGPSCWGSFEKAQALGTQLADSVTEIYSCGGDAKGLEVGSVSVQTVSINLPLNHGLSEKSLEEMNKVYTASLKQEKIKRTNKFDWKMYIAYIDWVDEMLGKLRKGTLPSSIDAEIKVIKIGPLTIVGMPFEVFHDIGIKIKDLFGTDNTIVIGYANGDFGYLPSKELYEHGHYETWDSCRYYGQPGPVCENADEMILDALRKLK
jgi:neutral ceramidase